MTVRLGPLERRPGISQDEQFLRWLRERRHEGVHTTEARLATIGNPGERVRELRKAGHVLVGRRERLRTDSVGKRWWLAEFAPDSLRAEHGLGPKSSPHKTTQVAAKAKPAAGRDTPPPVRSYPDFDRANAWVEARRAHAAAAGEARRRGHHPLERHSPAGAPPPGPSQDVTADRPPTAGGDVPPSESHPHLTQKAA